MPSNKVKNPEQMTHKKFVPGANPLVQIPRGWVAGTAGLPGDIEGLARLFAKYAGAPNSLAEKWGQQETPTLPTSEFYKEWLPLKDEGIGAAELNTLGSLAGGVGSTTLAGLAAKYGTKATKAAVANAMVPSALSKQAGVIKAKGLTGNWLAGSPDSALWELRSGDDIGAFDRLPRAIQRELGLNLEAEDLLPLLEGLAKKYPKEWAAVQDPIDNFIEKQLTNYIKSDMATPTDPVRLAIEAWPAKKQKLQGLAQAKLDFLNAKTQRLMTERDTPEAHLTRHRQEVLAAEKAKERIDLQEASHMPVNELQQANDWVPEDLALRRMSVNQPVHGMGQSEMAKGWESIADQAIEAAPASKHTRPLTPSETRQGLSSTVDKNPWIAKVPPETMIYSADAGLTRNLGFSHLIDELKNATNSASGLPKDLLLDPSTLGKTTLPQAVEHVAKINAWRAAQRAEADLVRANNAATVLHKDYPEQGMKWVELKAGKELPEGYKIENLENVPTLYGPDGTSLAQNWDYGTLVAQANRPVLRDALKYEGDTMVHCVGGYCEDVASGATRIFSLRNTKTGRPHVTIETMPSGSNSVRSLKEGNPEDYRINQIKGYKNRKPADEYLPYIQDFVKSGNWSDVKDLQNTGLVKYNKAFLDPTEYAGVQQRQAEALRFMETHPAFEQARQTSIARNKFEHKYGTPEYNALEKAYGQPIHPDMPYRYDEIMATVARPEETYSRGNDLADILEPALDRVNKLKAIHGDLPEGFAHGGSVYSPARYAEGGHVKNPEQMTHKKFVPGANPLVQIPRGFVAGTASLAREGEDLARLFAKYISAPGSIAESWGNRESVLPTNKFFRDVLPFKDEGVGADELQTLGSIAGGAGLPSLAKLTAKYAPKIALAAAEAGPVGRSAQRGVIKAKGLTGNWLSGSVEDATKALQHPVLIPENVPPATQALNAWIDKKLGKYIQNDMATEQDPIRALAEKGTLHYYPGQDTSWIPESMVNKRQVAGFDPDGNAKSLLAQQWEMRSDGAIQAIPAGKYQKEVGPGWEANMWLDRVDPGTPVYSMNRGTRARDDLGFEHLIDELRNATNPTSGLPADLLWKYSDLNKVTVPQAVERVAKINSWRAAQKAEADLMKANNAATVLHKDYPEKGMKWVELKAPEASGKKTSTTTSGKDELGFQDIDAPGDQMDAFEDHLVDLAADAGLHEDMRGFNAFINRTRTELLAPKTKEIPLEHKQLEDALKYEGDTMGHCVGGYCDDVASGATRIFSLRDAKGQPHVTIDVDSTRHSYNQGPWQKALGLTDEGFSALRAEHAADPALAAQRDHLGRGGPNVYDWLRARYPEAIPLSIKQIKGSGKKDNMQRIRMANTGYADNPDAHLVPYIQDFIRSGKWGDIKNLEHSGMQKWNDRYLTREDIDALSPDELDAFASRNVDKPGFSHGGSVYSPARVDEIVTQHRNSEYDPARVDALVAQLKEEMYA